jgi:hypothetical protein
MCGLTKHASLEFYVYTFLQIAPFTPSHTSAGVVAHFEDVDGHDLFEDAPVKWITVSKADTRPVEHSTQVVPPFFFRGSVG